MSCIKQSTKRALFALLKKKIELKGKKKSAFLKSFPISVHSLYVNNY